MAFVGNARVVPAVLAALLACCVVWAVAGGHALYDKEAEKYIGCAAQVLRGDMHDLLGNYLRSASYILFLVPFIAIKAPWAAIAAQAALSVAAAFAAGRLAVLVSGRAMAGTCTAAFMLCCVPLQQWVPALYTESFFTSMSLLFWHRLATHGASDRPAWLLAAVVLFARPVGFCFVVSPLLGALLHRAWPIRSIHLLAAAMVLVLVAAVSLPGIPMAQLRPIAEGDVICGAPTLPGMAAQLRGSSILAAQQVLFSHDPAMAIGLFARRVLSLFTLTRSHFSDLHNVFNAAYYPLLVLAAWGWWRARAVFVVRTWGVAIIAYVVLIGLTHDEWSGRFFVPLWPVVCVLAGTIAGRCWAR